MNDRIRELENQAEKFVLSIPAALDINEYTSIFNEKFAELIVSQCIFEVMHESTKEPSIDIQNFSVTVVNRIKKHFGIKK